MQSYSLISTLVAAFVLAFAFGMIANRLKLSPLVGYGYDHFGFSSVYVLMAGLVGACLLLSWTLLRKDPARNPSKNTVAQALELPAIAQSVTRYEP